MNILLVGAGGREHALSWKIAGSPLLSQLWIAPGNPGTAAFGINLPIAINDIPALVDFALQQQIDLVVAGPEMTLALGLADALREAGVAVFGPCRAAAQIESSKVFAKEFMRRHAIPTASHAVFDAYEPAIRYLATIDTPVVIKASGLASGKGVFLPASADEARQVLQNLLVGQKLGQAGREVIIEERLEGEEISLMAFTDGKTVKVMPPAQDHKRLLDGDDGPITGGMGAYAPVPACPPEMTAELARTILQPAIDGLRSEGSPFSGVLYAGLILTPAGPRVLEFNCRFGDPEAQAVLPLLENDFVETAVACASGTLDQVDLRWKEGACACVVLVAEDYPAPTTSSSQKISGLEKSHEEVIFFQGATKVENNHLATSGGRVLGVTAWAKDLPGALERAYAAVSEVHFRGMNYRSDIGRRGLEHLQAGGSSTYAKAGVDIDSGNRAVALMQEAVRSTYTPSVLAGIGAYGGLFDATVLKDTQNPVLVASMDGIGTKVMLAARAEHYRSLGHDIVNHCVDDILVQGATPLFFLDYFASSHLQPEVVAEVVTGMAEACREVGCVLIGGETAEMPGVYREGEFDVAGAMVGLVERDSILPHPTIQAGDILLGLSSSGPHTNGFSLLRHIFRDTPLDAVLPGLDRPLGEVLLAPHRSYLSLLWSLVKDPAGPVKGLAHITGGGLLENLPRILPPGLEAHIRRGSWPVPPLYTLAQSMGKVKEEEMARVFNLGIGMVVVADPCDRSFLQAAIPEETWVIGELVAGERKVVLV